MAAPVAAPVKTSAIRPAKKSTRKKTVDTTLEGEDIPEDWPVVRGDLVLVKWGTNSSNNMEEEYTMGTVGAYPIWYHHRLLVYLLSKKYR